MNDEEDEGKTHRQLDVLSGKGGEKGEQRECSRKNTHSDKQQIQNILLEIGCTREKG